jgi:hypothetical protein
VGCGADSPFFIKPALGRPACRTDASGSAEEEIEIANVEALELEPGRRLPTRTAGLFLFWPLLAKVRFDRVVSAAGYPGSKMVPACQALLSLLALKLLDKERRSHIDDFNCDEALGWWAGLNILPKKSFATDYSYRTQRHQQVKLLQGWIGKLSPLLFPDADSFALDFHTIPHRGEETELENHYQPTRGKAGPSILTFFAHEQKSRVLCYANANLIRDEQAGEVLQFVRFWHDLTGRNPQWLYFDSRLTTYAELAQLTQQGIWFVTIRRRGGGLLRRLSALPAAAWQKAVIDIPKRRHQQIQYVDERVTPSQYDGELRQVAVRGLGRERPTLFLCNNFEVRPRTMVMNYARRNGIEDALGSSVNFFHLDCLASEVRLNADLDTVLTVVAHGCYRWLANQLHGFDQAKPKRLYRKFVEVPGTIEITDRREIVVHFQRRAHNPILREAQLDKDCPPIPWLGNRRLRFVYI